MSGGAGVQLARCSFWRRLRYGRSGNCTSRQVAGLVPKKAVEWRDDVPVVRVFEEGEILERTLRVDGEEGDDYVVLYGVSVGESVVVPGPAQ